MRCASSAVGSVPRCDCRCRHCACRCCRGGSTGGNVGVSSAGATVTPVVSGPCAKAASAPGVSAHKIVTGMILTRTGSLAADFDPLQYGEEAYFKLVNSQGGVNGRKIDLAYVLDDGGNPSQFASLAHALVDQDHVFAVTGVASVFFTPNFLAATCTPTYGYTTENNWGGPPNFFGAGGSVIVDQDDGQPLLHRQEAKSQEGGSDRLWRGCVQRRLRGGGERHAEGWHRRCLPG